ncbi:MAG TPA: hypothetical protein V6C97_08795 [Oculatellaceae cyanobacterium]
MFGEIAPKLRGYQPPQKFGSQAFQTLASDVPISTSTWTDILTLTLLPGTYLVFAQAVAASTAQGTVGIRIQDTTAGTTLSATAASLFAAGAECALSASVPIVLTSSHTMVLQAQGNTGSPLIKALELNLTLPPTHLTSLYAVQITGGVMQLPPVIGSAPAFSQTGISLATSTQYSYAHGLGRLPNFVRAQLVCTTANLGYSVGDIVDVTGEQGIIAWNGGANVAYNGGIWFNNTNIGYSTAPNGAAVIPKSGGISTSSAFSNWTLSILAW